MSFIASRVLLPERQIICDRSLGEPRTPHSTGTHGEGDAVLPWWDWYVPKWKLRYQPGSALGQRSVSRADCYPLCAQVYPEAHPSRIERRPTTNDVETLAELYAPPTAPACR